MWWVKKVVLGGHPSGSAKLSLLKEAWEECAGEWRQSSLYRKITNKSSVSSHGARVWCTRDQICVKYNNNQEVANAICRAKEDDEILCKTQIKDHPDAPGVQAGHGFLVFSVVYWTSWSCSISDANDQKESYEPVVGCRFQPGSLSIKLTNQKQLHKILIWVILTWQLGYIKYDLCMSLAYIMSFDYIMCVLCMFCLVMSIHCFAMNRDHCHSTPNCHWRGLCNDYHHHHRHSKNHWGYWPSSCIHYSL